MNDLISRQAAIDIAPKLIITLDGYEMHNQAVTNYCAEITQLPPAQPAKVATDINVGDKDTISRKAAIEEIERWLGYIDDDMVRRMQIGMKRLPPAQPERIKGRWILVTDNNGQHFECNHCGEWRYHQEQKFCGECGADMREVTT